MNMLLNGTGIGSFTSALMAISEQGASGNFSELSFQDTEFAQLLSAQGKLPELLEELKSVLPPDQYVQLESMLTDGNNLPLAAVSTVPTPPPMKAEIKGLPALSEAPESLAIAVAPTKEGAVRPQSGVVTQVMPALSARYAGDASEAMPAADVNSRVTTGGHFSSLLLASVPSGIESGPSLVNPLSAVVTHSSLDQGLSLRPGAPTNPADLDLPLGAKGWDKALGERVLWMVGRSVQGAALRITPPNLGPIDIQLSLQQDQASVNFNVQHAAVREVLEASLPRLREMFQENNMQLVNVDVTHRDTRDQKSAAGDYQGGQEADAPFSGEPDEAAVPSESGVQTYRSQGLLDDYA